MTEAQILLQVHLRELGIETIPEYTFAPSRKFRFDLYSEKFRMGFECDGHFRGKHGAGWGNDYEKDRLAQMLGYRVMRFTNREVLSGKAKEFLAEWLK
jgi:very-short-patch-repair endonuclease